MAATPENNFRKRFVDRCRERYGKSVYIQKHHGSEYSAGLPDVLFMWQGKTRFVEFKAHTDGSFDFTKQPTLLQLCTLEAIQRTCVMQHLAYVVVYVKPVDRVISMRSTDVRLCRDMGVKLPMAVLQTLGSTWTKQTIDPLSLMELDARAFGEFIAQGRARGYAP